jgi:hypothetical protein
MHMLATLPEYANTTHFALHTHTAPAQLQAAASKQAFASPQSHQTLLLHSPPVINEHIVHLEVGRLAGSVIVIANEAVAQRVASLVVPDDVT